MYRFLGMDNGNVLVVATSLLVVLLGGRQTARADEAKTPPNILILIADDQGWHDIGYHDSDIKTPILDQLAAGGVCLQRHYVYPTCSPTRAALLSGRNASRFLIKGPIDGRSEDHLPFDTKTLAGVLKTRGYTTGLFGKWHLGLRPESGPRKFGFDQTYGYLHGQIDQYTHRYKNGDQTWHRNDQFIDEKGHATDLITNETIKFVTTKRKEPFFLWVAFSVPHHPVQEEDKWLAPYKDTIKDPSRRIYAASLTHMDAAIGRIVEALEKSGQSKNTVILFTSDNGGQKDYSSKTDYEGKHGPNPTLGDNRPLRGWKGDLYDGGVRVPAFVYAPGRLKPRVLEQPVSCVDWLPTFGRLAGAEVDPAWKLDGRDIWPLLSGEKATLPFQFYWNVPRADGIVVDDWKLIVPRRKDMPVELYNLADDLQEKRNLADEKPKKVEELRNALLEQKKRDPEEKKRGGP